MGTATKVTLEQRIRDLAAEVAALRDQLAGEVRTRRLVVVDALGAERVIAEVDHDHDGEGRARIEVCASRFEPGEAIVTIYAETEHSTASTSGGVAIEAGGEVLTETSAAHELDRDTMDPTFTGAMMSMTVGGRDERPAVAHLKVAGDSVSIGR